MEIGLLTLNIIFLGAHSFHKLDWSTSADAKLRGCWIILEGLLKKVQIRNPNLLVVRELTVFGNSK